MSVKILSTVETSCTTNPQQIEVLESEGYSWLTCSKQPRLAECRIGVVNKLDRRRWVSLTTRLTCHGEIFYVQRKVPWFLQIPNFPCNIVWDRWKEASMAKNSLIRPVVSTHYRVVWDGRMNRRTHNDSIYHTCIASCSTTAVLSHCWLGKGKQLPASTCATYPPKVLFQDSWERKLRGTRFTWKTVNCLHNLLL